MDKETKATASDNNALYDPDAAELLKDLEDDEEEGLDYVPVGEEQNNSLVSMLTSSANLGSFASSPVLSAVPSSGLEDKEDKKPLEVPSGKLSAELGKTIRKSSIDLKPVIAQDAGDKSEKSVSDKSGETPAVDDAPKDMALKEIDLKGDSSRTIKPFKSKPDSIPPLKSEPKSDDNIEAKIKEYEEIKPKEPVVEEEAEKESKPSTSGSKRPPVPPPAAPPASPAKSIKDSKENESVITLDALNDLLPGGKNDEARDLAAFKINDNNWYTQVFNEDFFRTIPKNSMRQTIREAKFIREHLGLERKARVLDLCCGFGRHTIELSKAGFDMVGLDLSMTMLKRALQNAQTAKQSIKFVHGDMRKLAFKAVFDAIYNVDTSFGYFDDLSNFRVLQGIYRALKPGGVFLIETINRDFAIDDFPLRLWWKGTECTILEEIDMDYLSGLLQVQRSFVFDGNARAPWEQKIQIRLYSVSEMRALLKRAGFNVVELSGDYSLPRAHFGAASPKNIFVAEKPVK